ncbi:MAG: PorT family protein [Bacteroidia bacterium]|nr:PorT family protein [Bacteroidia bacterium]
MWKVCLLLLVISLWGQGTRTWGVGLQFGINLPAYRTSQKVDQAVVLPGFTGGVQGRLSLKQKWALQGGIYFSQRNSAYLLTESYPSDTTVGSFRDEYTVHITNNGRLEVGHIEVPLLLEWSFLEKEDWRSYVLLGLHGGYQVFARNYGRTQVALEGLDFLPLFGFSPQTRVIVAEGPIEPGRVRFRRGDLGVWLGGGNAHSMGPGVMTFEVRFFGGVVNSFRSPAGVRFYNGSVMFLTGYLF